MAASAFAPIRQLSGSAEGLEAGRLETTNADLLVVRSNASFIDPPIRDSPCHWCQELGCAGRELIVGANYANERAKTPNQSFV